MSNTKVNIIFGSALALITLIIISYETCAQGLRLPPNGCRLLDLEKKINQNEAKIDTVYNRIARDNQIKDVVNFIAQERPKNIWETRRVSKPSFRFDRTNCDRFSDASWEETLKDMLRIVEIELEQALAKEKSYASQRPGVEVLARQKTNNGIATVKNEPAESPIIDIRKSDPAGAGAPSATPEQPRPKPVAQKIDIEHLDPNFGSKSVFFKGKDYVCVIVNPRSESYGIDFLWKDRNWQTLGSFGKAIDHLKSQQKTPVMLMNAGIFDENRAPLGLFYSNTKKIRKLNNKNGEGNFYLEPTGVFSINKNGTAKVITKNAYLANLADTINIRNATQSGPMLVINGDIHPEFRENSVNLTTRNGVGTLPDGRIVFAISKEPVNLYEFSQLFLIGFGCKNALYLDGTISKIYLPQLKLQSIGGDFAGMIAVYKK